MNNKIKRNDLCPCGSGKKYKKCCWNKKPRKHGITVDMGKPTIVNRLTLGQNGTVQFKFYNKILAPVAAFSRKWYDRKKGEKKLYDVPIDPNNLSLNQNTNLSKFDYIYAIDTNTKVINGNLISVCYCVKYNTFTKEGYMRGPIIFKNNPGVTEQTNWRENIYEIVKIIINKDDF